MRKHTLLFASAIILFLSGCKSIRQVYYVSPYNGNSNTYHTMPLAKDTAKSSTYIGLSGYTGQANTFSSDDLYYYKTNFYRSHQFNRFQAYYGASLSLGNYNVRSLDGYNTTSTASNNINPNAGNHFFGAYGLDGGMNIVIPVGRGEWRIIGIELSTNKEFGSYLNFRNKLPDSAADFIAKNSFYSTFGWYSEIMARLGRNTYFGFRIAAGKVIETEYNNLKILDINTNRRLEYGYLNFTMSYTQNKWSGYIQSEFGTKAYGAKFGVNYRLGR